MVKVTPMDRLRDIIELPYPIENAGRCREELKQKNILILENFLTRKALLELQIEAQALNDRAYYCSQSHNVLLTEKNPQLDDDHPWNIEVVSDKGCVPHDLIPDSSHLNTIYGSEIFQGFVQDVLELDKIYPYADGLSSINYNYYREHQQLGWHIDNASFAITLMIQAPDSGGSFQYVADARDGEKVDAELVDSILKNEFPVEELQIEEGTLVLFNGSNYLHRVTPVTSQKPRILATLNYNLEEGVKLSENARMAFFGRLS